MAGQAPRQRLCPWGRCARGAVVMLGLVVAGPVAASDITAARYTDPTDRYDHGILGDAIEWGALELRLSDGTTRRLVLPEARVFEDLEPRLVDVDGQAGPEVVAIETDMERGARLSVYGADGLIAATPYIGRTHRWLSPIGVADLDGDGAVELAYIDRPHLAKQMRIWRFVDGALQLVAERDGLTNHRIGQDFITGGLRDCGTGPEMVTVNADWSRVMVSRLGGGKINSDDAGPFTGPDNVAQVLACDTSGQ